MSNFLIKNCIKYLILPVTTLFLIYIPNICAAFNNKYTFISTFKLYKKIKMDLAKCVALALKNNRTIKNAYLSRIIQRYDLKVAEDEFVPDLFIKPSFKYDNSQLETQRFYTTEGGISFIIKEKIPTGGELSFIWANTAQSTMGDISQQEYNSSFELYFKQPLLKKAGIPVATAPLRISKLTEKINVLSLKDTLIDVITSAILAYREFYQAYKELKIAEKSLEMAQEIMKVNKELLQAGRMAPVDMIQAEANLANQRFNLSRAKNAFDAARLNLIKVLDIDKNIFIIPIEKIKIKAFHPDFSKCIKIAFKNRPDYRIALLDLKIAKINLRVAKNNRLWDLYIEGGYNIRGVNKKGLFSAINNSFDASNKDWYIGLGLTIPFGDLTLKQTYLNAEVNLRQTEINLQEIKENIEIEVMDAIRNVNMKLKQVELAKRARRLAEDKLRVEKEKLEAGRSTNFEVLTFQNDVITARNNELYAIISYENALTNLDRILGTTLNTWNISVETKRPKE